jgi:hypothetical protein
MASFYKDGDKLSFEGFKGTVIKITETYRKNVIVLKVTAVPKIRMFAGKKIETVGLLEYPDGTLEFMNIIE